jgi:uncharacterized phage-associated protein
LLPGEGPAVKPVLRNNRPERSFVELDDVIPCPYAVRDRSVLGVASVVRGGQGMSDVAGEPVSAHDVVREIRKRMPGVPAVKLHKLLFYCQGHHVGTFDVPLFEDVISAWDMGPVVSSVWVQGKRGAEVPAARELTEAQLNTVGYVLSRYGALTGRDLETLSHNQAPWQQANKRRSPGGSIRIELDWIRQFFVSDADDYEIPLDSDAVRKLLAEATEEPVDPGRPDDLERLAAMRDELLAGLNGSRRRTTSG